MSEQVEYFVVANSNAAPFVSDQSTGFVTGNSPEGALLHFAYTYRHPCGLYAADLYADATAYHKGAKPLASWRCNREIAATKAMERDGAVSLDGDLINGKVVRQPRSGNLVAVK